MKIILILLMIFSLGFSYYIKTEITTNIQRIEVIFNYEDNYTIKELIFFDNIIKETYGKNIKRVSALCHTAQYGHSTGILSSIIYHNVFNTNKNNDSDVKINCDYLYKLYGINYKLYLKNIITKDSLNIILDKYTNCYQKNK